MAPSQIQDRRHDTNYAPQGPTQRRRSVNSEGGANRALTSVANDDILEEIRVRHCISQSGNQISEELKTLNCKCTPSAVLLELFTSVKLINELRNAFGL
jgi:hypothetical protein